MLGKTEANSNAGSGRIIRTAAPVGKQVDSPQKTKTELTYGLEIPPWVYSQRRPDNHMLICTLEITKHVGSPQMPS